MQYWPRLGNKVGQVARYSALLRLTVSILFKKGNLLKVFKDAKTIVRFSAACSLFTLIYHVFRRIIRYYRKQNKFKLSQDLELFFACGLASLGLHAATEGDVKIFKVILFSRATIAVIRMIGFETGWFEPIKDPPSEEKRVITVEAVLAIFSCVFICYAYLFEANSMQKSLIQTVTKVCGLSDDEMRFFDSMRAIVELNRRDKMNGVV